MPNETQTLVSRTTLVEQIASKSDLPKTQIDALVRAYEQGIKDALAKGNQVRLSDFGTFRTKLRPARTSVNPQNPTGPKLKIAAKTVTAFKASSALSSAVGKKKAAKAAPKPAAKAAPKKK